jgi:hypothetical protein
MLPNGLRHFCHVPYWISTEHAGNQRPDGTCIDAEPDDHTKLDRRGMQWEQNRMGGRELQFRKGHRPELDGQRR